ncbi:MAG: protein translocase subunit SecD [Proteobacteria bacterium]|nr:protein translocase subunit SecD [Pseudomonadota bacterium]
MERSWWWKAIGHLLLIVVAVVYLIPTLVGEERLPGWYSKHVKAKLQLGLDLQGGIHLVYEVEVDKAVSDKTDRLAADIEERLTRDKKLKGVNVSREGRDEIAVRCASARDLATIDRTFLSEFRSNLDEVGRDLATHTVRLRLNSAYVSEVGEYAIRQAVETIRGRIDEFGVAEPTILRKGSDIVVELPGLTRRSFDRVKRQIGRTAQLEFKMVDDENDFMAAAAAKLPEKSPITVRSETYDGKQHGAITYTYLESRDKRALRQFLDQLKLPKDREILLGEEYAKDKKGNRLPDKIWITYFIKRRTELTGEYISDAQVMWEDRTGRPEVSLTFDRTGAEVFERLSGDNIGRRMAIVLDSNINSAPVLESRIGGGRARITLGGLRSPQELQEEANDLAAVLRTGALPAPLRKSFESQVGPTLGRDTINRGMVAFAVGAGTIILFMLYYYHLAGVFADLALLVNMLFVLALMAAFHATLTLPGIAGLVLTLGMSIDANVLVNERIREEMRLGKSARAAVDAGYAHAFWAIFDSQLTTGIAGIVLLQYGSGPIRGFAVTMLIGIATSIFTGVYVTRMLFDLYVAKARPKVISVGLPRTV